MKKHIFSYILNISVFIITSALVYGQEKTPELYTNAGLKIRHLEDTIGFPQHKWQMDSILSRISEEDKQTTTEKYKAVISPHDDYAYAAGLYKKTLAGIKAKTIVLVGVAHRARNFDLKDKIIFGSFNEWRSANGTIKVSPLRDKLLSKIQKNTFVIHNEMVQLEHSLEAITPFLKIDNRDIEILPMLVPYNTFDNMQVFSEEIAQALFEIMREENLMYGEDLAIVISSDAIHYGNTDWGSSNLAPFGVDSLGIQKAYQKDLKLIDNYLTKTINVDSIRNFNKETVKEENYMEYNWTWCGRYSIPFGLLMANKLNLLIYDEPLVGTLVDYRSSIHNNHIPVLDLGMGTTAPANNTHWVGYAGIKYN